MVEMEREGGCDRSYVGRRGDGMVGKEGGREEEGEGDGFGCAARDCRFLGLSWPYGCPIEGLHLLVRVACCVVVDSAIKVVVMAGMTGLRKVPS